MREIWTDQRKFEIWLEIENLACEAMAERGQIPKEDAAEIRGRARESQRHLLSGSGPAPPSLRRRGSRSRARSRICAGRSKSPASAEASNEGSRRKIKSDAQRESGLYKQNRSDEPRRSDFANSIIDPGQQTFARMKRPSLWTRTLPLANRSATVATVSLVLRVQELTATIRSPSESFFWRGLRIRLCFFIESTPF